MESNRLKIALGMLVATLLVAAGIVGLVYYGEQKDRRTEQTYYLGESVLPGYIGVTLTYDVEPITVELLSPSGESYGQPGNLFGHTRMASVYEVDKEAHTITILVDTDTKGRWNIRFARMGNKDIQYQFVTKHSPTMYLLGGDQIYEEDGTYYLAFTAMMETGSDTKRCTYSLQLESDQYSRMIGEGEANFNEETLVEITPPADRYDGKEYTLKLSVTAPSDDPEAVLTHKNTARRTLRVILEPGMQGLAEASPADASHENDTQEAEE